MENDNTTTTAILRQQQQQQQHFQLQQEKQQQQQQQQHENQQQFCLRWHNHQTSLLSSLPVLLDQSHLTDVTISAEGRTLRAHRVVLSACSTFFLELFRALDATNHPVIILPGASFAAIVALLTFMYSGEVNVYEEQIPVLLNLAETLGVKGLADVQSNKSASKRRSMDSSCEQQTGRTEDSFDAQTRGVPPAARGRSPTPTPPPPPPPPPPLLLPPPPALASAPPSTTFNAPASQQVTPSSPAKVHPFASPLVAAKFPTQLESFFLKSLQFYPNLLPQPLNFSQTALNKTTELLAKYQQQCSLYQGALSSLAGTTAVASKDILSTAGGGEHLIAPQRFAAMSPPGKGMLTHEDAVAIKRFCTADKLQSCSDYMQQQQQQQQQQHSHQPQKDAKRIDKIADNLRCGNNVANNIGCKQSDFTTNSLTPQQHSARSALAGSASTNNTVPSNNNSCNFAQRSSPQLGTTKPLPIFTTSPTTAATAATALRNQSPQQQQHHSASPSTICAATAAAFETGDEERAALNLQQQIEQLASCSRSSGGAAFGVNVSDASLSSCNLKPYDPTNSYGSNNNGIQQKTSTASALSLDKFGVVLGVSKGTSALTLSSSPGATGAQGKTPSNSKLYATCFICHKQLSNQYNLRVHLETHQNVRYACNVCTHVSRSKDALRKHVSYRHPGAPSPCETEARRKRASKILLGTGPSTAGIANNNNIPAASPPAASVSNTLMGAALDSGNSSASSSNSSEAQIAAAAAHLNSAAAAYMFLPNQFHLAAAAAAVVQQQQQQQQLQQQSSPQNMQCYNALSTIGSPATPETDITQETTCTTAPIPSAGAAVPETMTAIKLERQSPSSIEPPTSSPPTPQLQQQQQQQQTRNGDAAADVSATVQRSSPA